MSFSKVPDGAFTPDKGHGVEAHYSTGMRVVSWVHGWWHGATQGLLTLKSQTGTQG